MAPAFETDTSLVYGGLNGSYPWLPCGEPDGSRDKSSIEYCLWRNLRGYVDGLVQNGFDGAADGKLAEGDPSARRYSQELEAKVALLEQMVGSLSEIVASKDASIERLQGRISEYIKKELEVG